MYARALREKLGTAGLIVAIVALVAALTGGAVAATSGDSGGKATASAGKQGPRGPKGPKGAKGAKGDKGDTGATGAQGPKGDTGSAGAPGSPGANGKNIVTGIENPGLNCEEGGFYGEVEGSGSKKYACNGVEGEEGPPGAEGSPWTLGGVVPSGKTITGIWSGAAYNEANEEGLVIESVPISFVIPFATAPTMKVLVAEGETPTGDADCPGIVSGKPTAAAGKLCLYEKVGPGFTQFPHTIEEFAPWKSGAFIEVKCEVLCHWQGLWAATAL